MSALRRLGSAVAIPLLVLVTGGCVPWGACGLEDDGQAGCGVLLGITTATPTLDALDAAEAFAGRPYDLVYRFHEIDDAIPTDEERRIVESGRALHLSIDTRVDGARDGLTWRQVADGSHDAALRAGALGIAALGRPVFVTYEHEMDQESKTALGTPEDFIKAWRHVHDLFEAAGASNAVWVWVAMGTERSIPRASTMWPGNDVVDWISWDVYNASGCRAAQLTTDRFVTFEQAFDVFHSWLLRDGPGLGIDVKKPKMLSETGSVVYYDQPELTAQWYASMPGVLADNPDVRAIGLWDHIGIVACDYRFTGVEPLRATIRDLGDNKIFARLDLNE